MKKKKLRLLVLAAGILCSFALTAQAAGQKTAAPTSQEIHMVLENGASYKLPDRELPVYNIDSSNYMKIRDIGYLLDFYVTYDTSKQAVSITTNKHNDGVQVSSGAATQAQKAIPASAALYVDGNKKTGLTMYNIAGNNYVKLRDLAKTVDFSCCYNKYENSVDLSKYWKYNDYDISLGGSRFITYIDEAPVLDNDEKFEELHEGEKIYISNFKNMNAGQTFKNNKLTLLISEHNPYGKSTALVAKYGDRENGSGSCWDENVYGSKWTLSNSSTVSMKCEKDEYYESYTIDTLAVGTCELIVTAPNGETASCTIEVIDTTYSASYLKEMREEVFRLVNELRASEGVAPLEYADFAQDAADKRGEEILEKYSHTGPDGRSCFSILDDYGIKRRYTGENITKGSYNMSAKAQAEELFYAWECSEGHRKNMINSNAKYIAIGLYYNNQYGLDARIGCEMLLLKD